MYVLNPTWTDGVLVSPEGAIDEVATIYFRLTIFLNWLFSSNMLFSTVPGKTSQGLHHLYDKGK